MPWPKSTVLIQERREHKKRELIPLDKVYTYHWSQGKTEEEALENIKDAIETYLATEEVLS